MSQETLFRDAIDELRARGSRYAREAYVFVVATLGEPLLRAARNVPWLTVETPTQVSVYQVLHARQVVFERAALKALEEALGE